MSVASYPILKLSLELNFIILCSSFFLMFSYTFMSMQMSLVLKYIHHWVELYLNFHLVPCLVVQDIWQLKYRLFCRSKHFSFLLLLAYSFLCVL